MCAISHGKCVLPTDVNNNKLNPSVQHRGCCGVVVITSVLHTEGLQFDPGQQQLTFFILMMLLHAAAHPPTLPARIFPQKEKKNTASASRRSREPQVQFRHTRHATSVLDCCSSCCLLSFRCARAAVREHAETEGTQRLVWTRVAQIAQRRNLQCIKCMKY